MLQIFITNNTNEANETNKNLNFFVPSGVCVAIGDGFNFFITNYTNETNKNLTFLCYSEYALPLVVVSISYHKLHE